MWLRASGGFSTRHVERQETGRLQVSVGERVFSAVFGAVLIAIGIFALAQGHLSPLWRFCGGIGVVLFGANAVVAACRGRPSWLSRLGPLP